MPKIKVIFLGQTKTHNVEDYVAAQLLDDNELESIDDIQEAVQSIAEAFGRLCNRLAREGEAGAEDIVYIAGGMGDSYLVEK